MVFLIFLLVLPIFLLFLRKHRLNKHVHLPPGPRGLPVIGNLHQIDNSAPHLYLWKLSKKYGPLISLNLGFVPTIVVSSAKLAKEVMKTQDLIFCCRPNFLGQQKLSYNGKDLGFAPYNDYWREMRKICGIQLFNSNRVQTFRPIREDEVSRVMEKIIKSAAASKPTNLSEAMISLSITIICRVAFGKRYEEEGIERRRFHRLLKEAEAMFTSFFVSDHFPYMGLVDKLTGLLARLEKTFKELEMFYQELIDDHLDPKRPVPEQEDLLDILLQIWRRDREFKIQFTRDHIKAMLMDVFVAGTETSAATVIWAMTFLMMNPTAMKKAQEEVRNLIGKKGFVDEDDIQSLPYLKAVVKETMRLQPTVPLLIPRETSEKCTLDGYKIPPKTLVYVNAWAIGRDPEAWKNPEEFYPERFIGSSIDLKGQNFELIPFGAGRRMCPGISMGMANVETTLSNLVYKFDWEMPTGMKREDLDFDVIPGITMHKKNDLFLMARNYV